jgi:CBS domain-containing protein
MSTAAMTVEDIMSRRVETCGRDTPVVTVAAKMSIKAISCVLVVDQERIVGIVSERDIVKLVGDSAGQIAELAAEDVMSHPVYSIPPGSTLEEVREILRTKRFRRLPVVDAGGGVVGLVTQTDLLHAPWGDR